MFPFTTIWFKVLKKTTVALFITKWAPVSLIPEFPWRVMSIPKHWIKRVNSEKLFIIKPTSCNRFHHFSNCTLVTWADKLQCIMCSPPFKERELGRRRFLFLFPVRFFLKTSQFGKRGIVNILTLFNRCVPVFTISTDREGKLTDGNLKWRLN